MSISRTFRIIIATLGVTAVVGACSAAEDLGISTEDFGSTSSSTAPSSQEADPAPSGGDVDEETARARLAELTVEEEGTLDGYDREEFPHWSSQGDNCDTREVVLERDGTDVETGEDCYPTSGSWESPFDGETWTDPSDLDVDHIVPLAEAWRTGADEWSTDRRESFANDLDGVNLLAVTDNVNQSKGDRGPEEWLPPLESYHCEYAALWIDVKHTWELTVEQEEKSALEDVLATC
ncbi:HNH endonuclease family protein [Saccharomonospora iraqiensis]|uniref:HNH endonuclease family protein n=1 Tax=Saccharomonospora iraqiensis TaxID=52698 RepID=UPI00040DF612|nr:HNH endonuclease family protein [Saccharomonospora iraqiensis]